MAISYPLAIPTSRKPSAIDIRMRRAAAISASPFSFAQQAYLHPGAAWEAEVTLPPMARAVAAEWRAFIIALRGSFGTFTMGFPVDNSPRGTATAASVATQGEQRDTSLAVSGMGAGNTLLAGDYFSIANRLYMLVEDATADGTGNATLVFEPGLRLVATVSTALTLTDPMGTWRLQSNDEGWSVNKMSHYGFTFSAGEAL